jgi:hypothetical protein
MGFPLFCEMKKTLQPGATISRNRQAVKKAIIFLAKVLRTSTKFFHWPGDTPSGTLRKITVLLLEKDS